MSEEINKQLTKEIKDKHFPRFLDSRSINKLKIWYTALLKILYTQP